jgi:hypothetical protein
LVTKDFVKAKNAFPFFERGFIFIVKVVMIIIFELQIYKNHQLSTTFFIFESKSNK